MKVEFKAMESLSFENSFVTIKKQKDIELSVAIGVTEDIGWFELYDTGTGGNDWYAEGQLWFEGKVLTDYDGVFALPICITNKLEELGYDTSYAEQ